MKIIGFAQLWRSAVGEEIYTFDATKEQAGYRLPVDGWKKVGEPFPIAQTIEKLVGFGIMCTVTWTLLREAMIADGMSVSEQGGRHVRACVESLIADIGRTNVNSQALQRWLDELKDATRLNVHSMNAVETHLRVRWIEEALRAGGVL